VCTVIVGILFQHRRWAVHVARMVETKNAYRLLVGKPDGKRLLGRPRRRCLDSIVTLGGFYSGDYEECLMGCVAVWIL
jgi:hypothetical protein